MAVFDAKVEMGGREAEIHADVYPSGVIRIRGADTPWTIAGKRHHARAVLGEARLKAPCGVIRPAFSSDDAQPGDTVQVILSGQADWVDVAVVKEVLPPKQGEELGDRLYD